MTPPELAQRLAERWQLPGLTPAGETLSIRTWQSPFRVAGMAELVTALKQVRAVSIAAPADGWGALTGRLLTAALAAGGVAVRADAPELTLTAAGLRFGAHTVTATASLPLLVLHVAQALCFTASELFNQTLVAYDLEATGLGPHDELTEIGAVKIRNGVVLDTFQTLINPGRSIPPHIVELTSITNDMVRDAAQPRDAVTRFLEFFGDDRTIAIVHNGGFDLRAIRARAKRYAGRQFAPRSFDTRAYCQSLFPLTGNSLGELAQQFGVVLTQAHRALADAQATGEVFLKAYTLQNIGYQRFRREWLRLFALALAAWPGAEGEEERTLLHHLLTHQREYRWWRAAREVAPVNFDRYRAALAQAAAQLIADGVPSLMPTSPQATVEAGELDLATVTAQWTHLLEGYAPFLRHNPRPAFACAGARIETQRGGRVLTNGRTRVPLAAGDGTRYTPELQPHRWFGWLWPTVVVIPAASTR